MQSKRGIKGGLPFLFRRKRRGTCRHAGKVKPFWAIALRLTFKTVF